MTSTSSELIFYNGRITTLNPQAPTASALAIAAGMFAAVEEARDVMTLRAPGTRLMDLDGRAVVPSLNDGYIYLIRGHLIRGGPGSPALAPGGLAFGGAGSEGNSGNTRLLLLRVLSRRRR